MRGSSRFLLHLARSNAAKISLSFLFALSFSIVCVVADERVSYVRDVRPVLADACWQCHGPDESAREADLRLDRYADATADRDDGAAIVPRDAVGSQLMRRITSTDIDQRMPPDSTGKLLSADQIEILRQWINQGAAFEQHWSLQPIREVTPPAVAQHDWPISPIDHFVLRDCIKLICRLRLVRIASL